jgi:iron(III) transport system ATP-binding protein
MTVRLEGVGKSFGAAEVVSGVSFAVPTGTRMALVGASGSGKSTLLRLLAGFLRPDAGRIELDGRTLADDARSVPPHRRGIGYVAQDGALFPHLSVGRNIAFGIRDAAARRSRVAELMELAALHPDLLDRFPYELSGGQQQRVALVRALAVAPSVILLDEPFSALDTGLRDQTRDAVVEVLRRSGVTTILVTHDQEEALSFGEQLGVLAAGRLVQAGTPADVFDAPVDAAVAGFLGDAILLDARRAADGSAATVLGALAVRHDRSGGSSVVRAMLRPDQIALDPASGAGVRGVVRDVRHLGATADVRVRIEAAGRPPTTVSRRLPVHAAAPFVPGRVLSVTVEGGVVLYPAAAEPLAD